jgi:hypothetical protein
MRHSVVSVFLALAFVSGQAAAHIRLEVPKSRYLNDPQQSTKQKQAPCGVTNDARVTDKSLITTFKAGEKITVEWTETVNHPGHFRIAFSEKGQNFPAATLEPMAEGGQILADDIPDDNSKAGGKFTQEITLPNVTCDTCTLQLIQVMTDSGDYYFQCADLILEGDGAGGGGAGGAGGTGGGSGIAPPGGKSSAGSGGSRAGSAGMSTGGAPAATGGRSATGGSPMGAGGTLGGGGNNLVAPGGGGALGSTGGIRATGGTPVVTGGTPSSTGGAPATPTGGTAAPPPAPPSDSGDEGGCGIRGSGSGSALGLLGLGAVAALLRRRSAKPRGAGASSRERAPRSPASRR